jgi:hypothetical protein
MVALRIAPGLDLPVDVVTQAIAILARKGAGKTYTASVLVEEVIRAKVPVVVLDPTGAWWGLRTSADGEKPGLPVVIFGGDHGDVPLEPTAGAVVADVVVEHPGAYVLDLSAFPSKASEQRFAGDFLERLYRAKKAQTGPLLLVVDEADVFAPQRPGPEQTRTLGALESIVRRGRIKGLGDLLITQRAAVLNKNVLTQTEVLVVMQTTGPQDIAAVKEWVTGHATKEEAEDFARSLPPMEQGEAWVWSPAFLRIMQRVRIRRRTTFDSSRTPTAGEVLVTPRAFAKVDLEQLGARITATIEKAKADDPRELRRRIADLERTNQALAEAVPEKVIERVEVPVLNGQVDKLVDVVDRLNTTAMAIGDLGKDIGGIAIEIVSALGRVTTQGEPVKTGVAAGIRSADLPGGTTRHAASLRPVPRPEAAPRAVAQSGDGPSLGKAERAILGALASYPIELSREQLAFLAGYHPRTPGFVNALGSLRTAGYVTTGFPAALTEAGRTVAPVVPRPDDVVETWIARFGKAERAILTILLRERPRAVAREDLAAEAGYHPRTPGFVNALGKLRGLGLVDGFAISAGFDALIEASR